MNKLQFAIKPDNIMIGDWTEMFYYTNHLKCDAKGARKMILDIADEFDDLSLMIFDQVTGH